MNNLGFGLQISVIGMGLVFGLLALLWGLLALVGRLERTSAPVDTSAAAGATPARALRVIAPEGVTPDPELLAAIAVAVMTHKAVRRRQAAPAMRSYWPGSLLYASRWVVAGRARQTRGWQRRR